MADVKVDVAGLAMAGTANGRILQQVTYSGMEGYAPEANPVLL